MNARLECFCWVIFNIVFACFCGMIAFTLPVVAALEDQATALWSLTAAGRFSIALRSALSIFALSIIPTLFSYFSGKSIAAKDEMRANLNFKAIAIFVWFSMVLGGVLGAFAFWFRVHPWQGL